jgi:hypothetical protein
MVTETKATCPKCSSPMQDVKGGIVKCQNCGYQPGVGYRGDRCPNGCTAPIVTIPGAGRRCQQCSAQWG